MVNLTNISLQNAFFEVFFSVLIKQVRFVAFTYCKQWQT